MKFLAGVTVGILLTSGFFIYYRTPPLAEKTQVDFHALSFNEAKRFAEATNTEDKLKAAEELYGKMMVLFLANLGLELQKSKPVANETLTVVEEKASSTTPEVIREIVKECAPCSQAAATAKKTDPKKVTTPDKFKTSAYMSKMDAVIKKMMGMFAGKLSYFAGNRRGKIDNALIDVELTQKDQALDGSINVVLTDETGLPYSRNRGRGGNKTIRYNPDERMVYVEASPNSFFSFRAQEFNQNEVKGEYYEDNTFVGRAIFYRQ